MEDWRDTLWTWYDYATTGTWTVGARTHARAIIQRQRIDDILENAKRREYLLVYRPKTNPYDIIDSTPEGFLYVDDRGRNFLKPLSFLEASLKEYSHVVASVLGGGGVTLLIAFWNSIVGYLAEFLGNLF
jgi:hypothetical protein